jgi:ATP-binding cassette subfamily B protein
MLFVSQSAIETVRSWLLLHLSARINISILSDFLSKIMKLPVSFFESKMTGDLLQRIEDNQRIENFLSSTTLNVLFSMVTLVIFGTILATYDLKIFFIFLLATIIYIAWVVLFVKKRAILDYQRHDEAASNRSGILQLINGITEIKLNNSQLRRRWEWEIIQMRLYKVLMKGLALGQIQSNGANFINQLKNIIIVIVAAENVVRGHITLGSMMAIQYIIGQLNTPINSLITFFQSAQDARLSIKRLAEIHNELSEEDELSKNGTSVAPQPGSIKLVNASFRYGGTTRWILNNINLEIPQGKVTAIVGTSGSGKTTLLKLILKLYKMTQGEIRVADENILNINTGEWRSQCGVVMQDGFIFSDTVARNISESASDEPINKERLQNAVTISNLGGLIENLPNGYTTNLGYNGVSLSGGEKQRILIARAVYKSPSYLFLDEATSSLDANNEKEILGRLSEFYKGRTVIIIAHRLSTVKNADQIVVMNKGGIAECGTHEELVACKGHYYTLIKNQLELGN